jgi:hypothetical protein
VNERNGHANAAKYGRDANPRDGRRWRDQRGFVAIGSDPVASLSIVSLGDRVSDQYDYRDTDHQKPDTQIEERVAPSDRDQEKSRDQRNHGLTHCRAGRGNAYR